MATQDNTARRFRAYGAGLAILLTAGSLAGCESGPPPTTTTRTVTTDTTTPVVPQQQTTTVQKTTTTNP